MTSSGMKRGLATAAISALAMTGLPAIASAAPLTTVAGGDDAVVFYSQQVAGISAKDDGTNKTVSLVTGGGKNVTSVLYQYESSTALGTWTDVPGGLVARNADGVFAFDWASVPATVTQIRAVPNTGEANAKTVTAPTIADTAAHTVELGTEGSLGVFQEPYTESTGNQQLVAVHGTVSDASPVKVKDVSDGGTAVDATVTDDGDATTSETFSASVDIAGYSYSAGTEPNQIAFNAATAAAGGNTDDAEGSTLYVQKIGSIDAAPATQETSTSKAATATVTLTVKDTQGQPVAGAQVGRYDDKGTASTADDVSTLLPGTTDGNGQMVVTPGAAGTFTYYVNTTDTDAYEPGTDPSDTATVTTYTPALSTVNIVNEHKRSNVDLDELDAANDDFSIVTKDQRGNAINEDLVGNDVEYRWVIDPAGAATAVTSPWIGAETDANGKAPVANPTDTDYATWSGVAGAQLPAGSYTLEARRPNVSGSGLTNAAPVSFTASESEITYDEGTKANAPVNGSFTVTGTLANADGGLGGRQVNLTYNRLAGDAGFAPQAQQPAGVKVTDSQHASVVTDANGNFSVKLMDQPIPSNVTPITESGTLNAIAQESPTDTNSLQGNVGPDDSTTANAPANAEQDLAITWQPQAVPASVVITPSTMIDGQFTPGRPADLDVVVKDKDGNALSDFPVSVSVDHGFLTPANLTPASGAGDKGDLYGVWKNDGTSKDVSTGDNADADIAAAIQRDAGFDDDGLVNLTVTVKAGSLTETKTITFNSDNPLNSGGLSIVPMPGQPQGNVQVGQTVDYNVFAKDQFGNLAGNEFVRVLDDSTVADFVTDSSEDEANTDFSNDGSSITAFSDGVAKQILEGRWATDANTWDANGHRSDVTEVVTAHSAAINWVSGRSHINALLGLSNRRDGSDIAKVDAPSAAAGATVKLYKVRADGSRKLVATKAANRYGNARFVVADRNGRRFTRYQALVGATSRTFADWTPKGSIR